jgi:hypothetical protein
VVFQLSDDDKIVVKVSRWVDTLRTGVSRSALRLKRMRLADVVAIASKNDLEVVAVRRHLLLLFPGMARMLGRWLVPYDRFTQRHQSLARHAGNVIVVCRLKSRQN